MSIIQNNTNHFSSDSKRDEALKRTLGKTGFRIFPVVFGGIISMRDGQEASDDYVSWSIERGINYFDVAPTYEDAQEKLGNSLKPYRKDIFLACKTMCRLRSEAEIELKQSFELLQTDYFDVYQMHAVTTQQDIDQAFGPHGVLEMMIKAKQNGLVRKLGITAHSEEMALKAMALYDFDTVMFPMNWQMNMRNQMGTKLCLDAKKRGMGILAIKPLVLRRWKDESEKNISQYPKSWVKPIDIEKKQFGIAALKYSFHMGADAFIPPGDFKIFSFTVENIQEVIINPFSSDERGMLEEEYITVKDFPFFD
jgi:aryl-alcohol dehydrogenase-like predicted oxidoreductase